MRENIEWLIGQYTDSIENLERDAQEQSIGLTYIKGQIVAYKTVVGDLQNILDESEVQDADDHTDYERYKDIEMIAQGVPLPAECGNLVDINDVATALIYSGICDTAKCGKVKELLSKIPIIVERSTE